MARSRLDAKHEAAHAVTAIRLGLPLLTVEIRGQVPTDDDRYTSSGFTGLDALTLRERSRNTNTRHDTQRSKAVFAAAGVAVEHLRRVPP